MITDTSSDCGYIGGKKMELKKSKSKEGIQCISGETPLTFLHTDFNLPFWRKAQAVSRRQLIFLQKINGSHLAYEADNLGRRINVFLLSILVLNSF